MKSSIAFDIVFGISAALIASYLTLGNIVDIPAGGAAAAWRIAAFGAAVFTLAMWPVMLIDSRQKEGAGILSKQATGRWAIVLLYYGILQYLRITQVVRKTGLELGEPRPRGDRKSRSYR
jgi:hypothetical protein